MIADDRRRQNHVLSSAIVCVYLRSPAINCDCAIIWKPVLRSAIETHPITFRVLSHDSMLVCSIVRTVYVFRCHHGWDDSNEEFMEEVSRYECVYHSNSKDFKDKKKEANFWDKIGQKFNLSTGETDVPGGFGADDDVASWKSEEVKICLQQNALQPTRACIFDISADQNVWLRSALRSLRLYGNSLFFAIACDHSTIIWKPALR